jgi:L-arabinokinase
MRRANAALVVSDAPPLACEAAALAGIPSLVIANFTWDWIYQGYSEYLFGAPELVPSIQRAYARAEAAWRLPMHGGFDTFGTVIDVPFVARHSRREADRVRAAFNLPLDKPLVLSSFGGVGIKEMDLGKVDCLGEFAIVHTVRHASDNPCSSGVFAITESSLYERGFRYEDLVRAADVVVTKPGYGIISECIANDSAMLYTSRGRFAEYDVLVREMPRFLRCRYIEQDTLFAGRWREGLRALLASPSPPERPATDGAQVIARRLLEFLQ